jgi:ABC-2 type transport system permease protein
MRRLLAVIERDLIKFKRNPVVIAMSILMPIIYLVILGNSFQGKLTDLPVAVVNQDSGPYAKRVMENLRAIQAGPKTFRITNLLSEGEAVNGVKEGIYKAAVIIPADFNPKNVAAGQTRGWPLSR